MSEWEAGGGKTRGKSNKLGYEMMRLQAVWGGFELAGRQVEGSGGEKRPKLLDQLREALPSRHNSRQTGQIYCKWIRDIIARFSRQTTCHAHGHSFVGQNGLMWGSISALAV